MKYQIRKRKRKSKTGASVNFAGKPNFNHNNRHNPSSRPHHSYKECNRKGRCKYPTTTKTMGKVVGTIKSSIQNLPTIVMVNDNQITILIIILVSITMVTTTKMEMVSNNGTKVQLPNVIITSWWWSQTTTKPTPT